ncbi:MAG: hypothetical protein HQ475_08475 [SAR202 cluster bacterium]|nr:hypothetical protein [SAR202 cluster bacterium]
MPLDTVEAVQVLVRLPYCLYIPSTRYLFNYPNSEKAIGIVPQKIWTERASGSTNLSAEQVVATESVHLAGGQLETDWIGQVTAQTGDLQATNMEFDRDPSGYFRYTLLTVEFDWEVPSEYQPPAQEAENTGEHFDITEEMSTKVLPFVNHFINLYRHVTGDVYIDQISVPVIDDIRIGLPDRCNLRKQTTSADAKLSYKHGFHPRMMGTHGIRPAMVSKPKEVVESFRSLLEDGFQPSTDEILHQNALAALERHDVKLSAIESFTSLEIFVERFYYGKLSGPMQEDEIEHLLTMDRNWQLPIRLKDLLKSQFGKSVSDIDNKLWERWYSHHKVRNDIVHRNHLPTEATASEILETNAEIKRILVAEIRN